MDRSPSARQTYERLQHFDARLTSAFQQVAVPSDLAAKILARLQAEPQAVAQSEAATITVAPVIAEIRPVTCRRTTRAEMVAASMATAASLLVVALGVGYWPHSTSTDDPESFAEVWCPLVRPNWKAVSSAPKGYSVPSSLAVRAKGWQQLGQKVAAFDLSAANAARATLFVVKRSMAGLPSQPPMTPQSTTGGRSVGAWQSAGFLYVLVVDGDERSYRRLINTSVAPLASRSLPCLPDC